MNWFARDAGRGRRLLLGSMLLLAVVGGIVGGVLVGRSSPAPRSPGAAAGQAVAGASVSCEVHETSSAAEVVAVGIGANAACARVLSGAEADQSLEWKRGPTHSAGKEVVQCALRAATGVLRLTVYDSREDSLGGYLCDGAATFWVNG